MKSRPALALFVALGSIALCGAGGCSSSPAREQLAEIRSNPTPELKNLHMRQDDIDNQITVTFDTNLRMFSRDLGKFMLLDRPSHLSPAPVR
ncbi:MAG: hypothetical protein AB7K52_10980 [Phycisphaerales bacterium]